MQYSNRNQERKQHYSTLFITICFLYFFFLSFVFYVFSSSAHAHPHHRLCLWCDLARVCVQYSLYQIIVCVSTTNKSKKYELKAIIYVSKWVTISLGIKMSTNSAVIGYLHHLFGISIKSKISWPDLRHGAVNCDHFHVNQRNFCWILSALLYHRIYQRHPVAKL